MVFVLFLLLAPWLARLALAMESPLMPFREAAAYLGVPDATLRHWLWLAGRGEGRAPRSVKIGRHRKFMRADLDAFIEARAEEAS